MREGGKSLLIQEQFEVAKNASGDFNITKYLEPAAPTKRVADGRRGSEGSLLIQGDGQILIKAGALSNNEGSISKVQHHSKGGLITHSSVIGSKASETSAASTK